MSVSSVLNCILSILPSLDHSIFKIMLWSLFCQYRSFLAKGKWGLEFDALA